MHDSVLVRIELFLKNSVLISPRIKRLIIFHILGPYQPYQSLAILIQIYRHRYKG